MEENNVFLRAGPSVPAYSKTEEPRTPPNPDEPNPKRPKKLRATAKAKNPKAESMYESDRAPEEMREAEVEVEVSDHPWAVRKHAKGRSDDLSPEELSTLRAEAAQASADGIPWAERGPAQQQGSRSSNPSVPNWRGQAWRPGAFGGKQRFSNRGGKNKEYFARLNKAGLLKPTPKGAVRVSKPEDMPW